MTTNELKWAFAVQADDHDLGSAAVKFLRPTRERAEWSADLMRQCGYRAVTVKAFLLNQEAARDIDTETLRKIANELVAA